MSSLGYSTTWADTDHPINDPIAGSGLQVATRLNPQPIVATAPPPVLWTTENDGRKCLGMIPALEYWSPGWDVQRMAGIAWRESNCVPWASNSCCTGIFQIHRSWISKGAMCGVYTREDLKDPWKNICMARIVYQQQGMGAWSTA